MEPKLEEKDWIYLLNLEASRDALKAKLDTYNDCVYTSKEIDVLIVDCDCLKAENNLLRKMNIEKQNAVDFQCRQLNHWKSLALGAEKALYHINSGFCEGNADDHGKCEQWMRDRARLGLAAFQREGEK